MNVVSSIAAVALSCVIGTSLAFAQSPYQYPITHPGHPLYKQLFGRDDDGPKPKPNKAPKAESLPPPRPSYRPTAPRAAMVCCKDVCVMVADPSNVACNSYNKE